MTQVTRKAYQLCILRNKGRDRLNTVERDVDGNNVRFHLNCTDGRVVACTVNDRDYWIGV